MKITNIGFSASFSGTQHHIKEKNSEINSFKRYIYICSHSFTEYINIYCDKRGNVLNILLEGKDIMTTWLPGCPLLTHHEPTSQIYCIKLA